jgi:N-glycosylase/DNA lyase
MKKLTIAIILNGIALLGFSQDSAKIASIKELLEVTGSGKLGVQAVQNMIASYRQNLPSVPEEFWNEFMKEVNTEVLTTMVIPIYDKYYSLEELNAIIAFYKTPIGKKVIATLPQIMQESMQAGQSWGKEVGEKAFNKLKEQGFIKD